MSDGPAWEVAMVAATGASGMKKTPKERERETMCH